MQPSLLEMASELALDDRLPGKNHCWQWLRYSKHSISRRTILPTSFESKRLSPSSPRTFLCVLGSGIRNFWIIPPSAPPNRHPRPKQRHRSRSRLPKQAVFRLCWFFLAPIRAHAKRLGSRWHLQLKNMVFLQRLNQWILPAVL